jgi:DNA-binding MarR family transcriptional regulator
LSQVKEIGIVHSVTAATREAWELLSELFWSDAMHERFHAACEELDVSPPMFKTMLLLEAGDGRPMRAIAEQLRCDASWVTSLIDGLEEKGYVERRTLPSDRRVKTIALTEEGVLARKRALTHLHEPPASFSRLTGPEARQLRDLLRKALAGT